MELDRKLQMMEIKKTKTDNETILWLYSSVWEDLLAVWRHVSEDTEQELALLPGVKGGGDDDVTALL